MTSIRFSPVFIFVLFPLILLLSHNIFSLGSGSKKVLRQVLRRYPGPHLDSTIATDSVENRSSSRSGNRRKCVVRIPVHSFGPSHRQRRRGATERYSISSGRVHLLKVDVNGQNETAVYTNSLMTRVPFIVPLLALMGRLRPCPLFAQLWTYKSLSLAVTSSAGLLVMRASRQRDECSYSHGSLPNR